MIFILQNRTDMRKFFYALGNLSVSMLSSVILVSNISPLHHNHALPSQPPVSPIEQVSTIEEGKDETIEDKNESTIESMINPEGDKAYE